MKKILSLFIVFLPLLSISQNKKPLNFSVYDSWNSINSYSISNDGKLFFYEIKPYIGDSKLVIYDVNKKNKKIFPRGNKAVISPNGNYIAFKIKPQYADVRQLKLDKVKKNELPKDSLCIYTFSGKIVKFKNLKSFTIPKEKSDWMEFSIEKEKDTSKTAKKKIVFDENAPKTAEQHLYNPLTQVEYIFQDVSETSISRNGKLFAFVKLKNDSLLQSTLFVFDPQKKGLDSIVYDGLITKVKVDNKGRKVAFLFSSDTIKEKRFALYLYDVKSGKELKIADTLSSELPNKWTASINGKIFFSRDDKRLFFGSALRPLPEPKDTLLNDEKIYVDVWSWTDVRLQPQQIANKNQDLKRTYLTEYIISDKKLFLLADKTVRYVDLDLKATNDYFLGSNPQPYLRESSWNASFASDYYRINASTGEKKLVLKKGKYVSLSPDGNNLLYYQATDSCWYIKNLSSNITKDVTTKLKVPFYDEQNDYPQFPNSYGMIAWDEQSKFVLIYDRYDIWKINIDSDFSAVNITNGFGRKNKLEFKYMNLDSDEEYVTKESILYLRAFNENNKQYSYYKTNIAQVANPIKLYSGKFLLYNFYKAKNSDEIIFRRQSFTEYSDIWLSDVSLNNPVKISDINPQQKDYLWGTAELVKWITTEGTEEEGVLYKPDNFDPNKKYPMIVYFYRLHSDNLYRHYIPRPSRSTINISFYTSNDYIVFVPNIRYKVGYPGMSAYNYIVGGTSAMLNKYDFIDSKKLGIQGQSWGGYQVSYVITQTDMFAAASAGATVANMTSAYGGIRWKSGMSRMFQYEKTQSRIGGTLWDKPFQYIENSPIFYVPKINTPLLLRHDDADGAVPWYQSIELFVAMRRLNKPVWMLNYNDQPHNLEGDSPGCKDLSIRMKQYFDHYLKDEPAPKWMIQGIPAIDKGKDLGYELLED